MRAAAWTGILVVVLLGFSLLLLLPVACRRTKSNAEGPDTESNHPGLARQPRGEMAVMILDEITALEYEWLKKMPDHGFFEERDKLFQKIGVYDAWQRIFREYVMLARTGDKEALKRAVFLHWYSLSEPHELNGIPALDKDLVQEAFGLVDNMLQTPECDAELKWMLPYYYSVADFYITSFGPDRFGNVLRASKENKNLWLTACLESTFENRGQMGKYWGSSQKNAAKWGPEGPPRPPRDWHPETGGKSLEERVLNLLREERGK